MENERLRVLIVDDEISVRLPLQKRLKDGYGYLVEVAADGHEAVQKMKEAPSPFEVAVIDQNLMHGPDGTQLMQEIRSIYPDIECIIMTGWGAEARQRALEAGAFRYIEKPYDSNELAINIRMAALQVRMRAISRLILTTHDRGYLLDEICRAACSLTGADQATIALLQPATGQLVWHPKPSGSRSQGWAGLLDEQKTLKIIHNGRGETVDDVLKNSPIADKASKNQLRAWLAVPIPGVEGNLGALYVFSQTPSAFSAHSSRALLQTLSGQAGLAITNAVTYQQMSLHAGYMEALVRAGEELSRRTVLDEQLEVTWEFVCAQLKIPTFILALYDTERQTLYYPLAYDRGKRKFIKEVNLGKNPFSGGFSGFSATRGQVLFWQTTEERLALCHELGITPRPLGGPCQTGIFLPLKAGERVLGMISIQSYEPYAFSPVLFDAFRALGSHLVVALENTRILQEMKYTSTNLHALNRVVMEIGQERSRDSLLHKIIQQSIELLDAKGGAIYLLETDNRYLICTAGIGINGVGQRIRRNEGLSGKILETGRAQHVDHYRRWDHRLKRLDNLNLTAVCGVPIRSGEQVLGTLVVHDTRLSHKIDETQLALLQQLADHAGLALQKIDLLHKLEMIQKAATEISASLDFTAIVKKICSTVVGLFDVDHCAMAIFENGNTIMRVVGEYPSHVGLAGQIFYPSEIPAEESILNRRIHLYYPDLRAPAPELGFFRQLWLKKGISTIAIIPVLYEQKVIGSFSLEAMGRVRPISPEEIELCKVFAAHVAVAIEKARLFALVERRGKLLDLLEEASRSIRAERETPRLLHETIRQATQLVGGEAGALLVHLPYRAELELMALYNLPDELLGQRMPLGEGLAGQVARTGKLRLITEYADWQPGEALFQPFSYRSAAGVPLIDAREVDAILLVFSNREPSAFDESDLEILERFAVQAAIALHASRLITGEQRVVQHLNVLSHLNEYIHAARDFEKMLHAILTGVTAGNYGLGFNRAAVLLLDEQGKTLSGRLGIGHVDEAEARRTWEKDLKEGRQTFKAYRDLLEAGLLPTDPIDTGVRSIQLPYTADACGLLYEIMQADCCQILSTEQTEGLPEPFLAGIQPGNSLVVVPLKARSEPIGLLAADNKFTGSPVTPEIEETLLTFSRGAALAIDNAQLYRRASRERERLRYFFEASNALRLSESEEQVLQDIVSLACSAAGAMGVSIILIDRSGEARKLISAGEDREVEEGHIVRIIRPDGISHQVMNSGRAQFILDTFAEKERVNPDMIRRNVRSAACLPMYVHEVCIGVMWFHFWEPGGFSQGELDAMQLYAIHAALAYTSSRRIKEQKSLRSAAEALARVRESKDLLDQIVKSAREVLEADSAAFWTYDEVQHRLLPERSVSSGISLEDWERLRVDKAQVGKTAAWLMTQDWVGFNDIDQEAQASVLGASTRRNLKTMGVKSFQVMALQVGDEKLGLLFVNYKQQRDFHENDIQTALTFANHVALALMNARLMEQVKKARQAAKVVADVTRLGDIRRTLKLVVEETLSTLGCDAVTLYTYDPVQERLGYPPTMEGVQQTELVTRYSRVVEGSIIYQVLQRDEPLVVEDAQQHPLFYNRRFTQDEGVKSLVGIPLQVKGEKVGVMFVNYRHSHRFTPDERTNIELFSSQAAVAIHNAQLFQTVEQTKVQLAASNALVWVSMVTNRWRHAIENHAQTIQEQVQLLRMQNRTALMDMPKGLERLNMIEQMAVKIKEKPITPPLSEEDIIPVSITELVRIRLNRLWKGEPYKRVQLEQSLSEAKDAVVRANPDWLRSALDILVDNAVEVTAHREDGKITVSAHLDAGQVQICIADNGPGFDSTVREMIFKQPVPKKPNEKGLGLGLLMAYMIVRAYGGDIKLASSPNGTTMTITLPTDRSSQLVS